MKRSTSHPRRRARRVAALDRREKELKQLLNGPVVEMLARCRNSGVDRKVALATEEVATLRRKLGLS